MLLKQLRTRQRLTQQQLAKALGVHRNTIGRWEEGSFLPESKALLLDLTRCLHLDEQESRQLLDTSLIAPMPLWSVSYPRNPFFTGREDIMGLCCKDKADLLGWSSKKTNEDYGQCSTPSNGTTSKPRSSFYACVGM